MALRATVAVKRGAQANAIFTGDLAFDRIHFCENTFGIVEVDGLIGCKPGKRAAGARCAAARSGIGLGPNHSCKQDCDCKQNGMHRLQG